MIAVRHSARLYGALRRCVFEGTETLWLQLPVEAPDVGRLRVALAARLGVRGGCATRPWTSLARTPPSGDEIVPPN